MCTWWLKDRHQLWVLPIPSTGFPGHQDRPLDLDKRAPKPDDAQGWCFKAFESGFMKGFTARDLSKRCACIATLSYGLLYLGKFIVRPCDGIPGQQERVVTSQPAQCGYPSPTLIAQSPEPPLCVTPLTSPATVLAPQVATVNLGGLAMISTIFPPVHYRDNSLDADSTIHAVQVATVSLGGSALISFHRVAEDGSAGALVTEVCRPSRPFRFEIFDRLGKGLSAGTRPRDKVLS